MSLAAYKWVWEHSSAVGLDRLVLLAIADHIRRPDGSAWPSYTRLADMCGVSRRSVIRSVERLVGSGDLECVKGGGQHGRGGMSNSYRLPRNWCQGVTSDGEALVTSGPEVVTGTTGSGDRLAPEPQRTTQNRAGRPGGATQSPPGDPMARPSLRPVERSTEEPAPTSVALSVIAGSRRRRTNGATA